MANKKITELTLASPSSSASVVGEDGGVAKRFPVSSFGGGGGIIDVTELPTENINANAIYRIAQAGSAAIYQADNGSVSPMGDVIIISEFPQEPIDALSTEPLITAYYLTTDEVLYLYFSTEQSAGALGASVGWNEFETLLGAALPVVSSVDEIPADAVMPYLVLVKDKIELYHYCNGEFKKIITSDSFEFNATTGTLVLNL
jgi:hypothetical protein